MDNRFPFISKNSIRVGDSKPNINRQPIWTPSEISTVCWYDPSDISTITDVSSSVSGLDDKSGNGYHLTQLTGTNQPLTGTKTYNGNNVLSFDYNNNQQIVNSSVVLPSGNIVVLFVAEVTDSNLDSQFSSLMSMDSTSNDFQLDQGSAGLFGNQLRNNNISNNSSISSGLNYSGLNIFGARFNNISGEINSIVNGDSVATGDYISDLNANMELKYFGNRSGTINVSGYGGEMLIIDTIDIDVIQLAEGYLAWKWGIQSKLVSNHPYKFLSPKL